MSATAFPPADPDTPSPLIFHWGRRVRVHWRLGLMIGLSLLAHAASFYVLQVAYSPTGSLLPPPARVLLVPLDQPENAPLARWLALADPVLAMQSSASSPDEVLSSLGFGYVPSYDAAAPAFKPLEPAVSAEGIAAPPRPLPPGPVAVTDAPINRPELPRDRRKFSVPAPSRVILSDAIRALAPAPLPPFHFPGNAGRKTTEPTVLLVGIRPEGGTPFLFPMRQTRANGSSGDAEEMDEAARDYLTRLDFHAPADSAGHTVWGRATFYRGGDSVVGNE